jgi:ABC-type transport system substrate-binding protein
VRMRSSRRRPPLRAALGAAVVLLAVAGCRGGAVDAVPDPPARVGGTLRVALDTDPVSVTPLGGGDAAGLVVERNVFAGLVDVDPATLHPVPAIARRWKVSADRRTYTFTLRGDVVFQGGAGPVTAETFVRDWTLLCSPEVASPNASVLRPLEGFPECSAGSGVLTGVRALGPQTLQVRLRAPYRNFVASLGDPATWAFPPDLNDTPAGRAAFEQAPLGAGPFEVTTITRTQRPVGKAETPGLVVLQRNPVYYGPAPRLNRVELPVMAAGEHPARVFKQYRARRIDVLAVPPELVDIVRADPGLRGQLIGYPRLELTYLRAPRGAPAGQRRAVAHALNPRRVVTLSLGKFGLAADGIVPVGTPGYVPEVAPPAVPTEGSFGPIVVDRPSDPLLAPIADATATVLGESGLEARVAQGGPWEVEVRALPYPSPEAAIGPFATVTPATRAEYGRLLATGDGDVQVQLQREILGQAAIVPIAFGQTELLLAERVAGFRFDGMGIPRLADAWIRRG